MKKISLIGAGNIGTILAYSISRKKLGNIVLVDVLDGLAKGKCLDLSQSLSLDNISADIEGTTDLAKIKQSDVIIITAGIARKPGMSRDDLIETNLSIIVSIGKAIKRYSKNSFVICITNPLDAMVWSLIKSSGLPKNMVIGMAGVLDTARFKLFLSQTLNVSMDCIQTMVLGGHGDTMVPLLDYTSISGIPLNKYLKINNINPKKIDSIIHRTRNGGGEIVSLLKSSSAFFAPAASAIQMLESFLFNKKLLLPCSAFLSGEYGFKNICVGVPVLITKNGVERIIELDLDKYEIKEFKKSVSAVQVLTEKCKKLLVKIN